MIHDRSMPAAADAAAAFQTNVAAQLDQSARTTARRLLPLSMAIAVVRLFGLLIVWLVFDTILPGRSYASLAGVAVIAAAMVVAHTALTRLRARHLMLSAAAARASLAQDRAWQDAAGGRDGATVIAAWRRWTAPWRDGAAAARSLDRPTLFVALALLWVISIWLGLAATVLALLLIFVRPHASVATLTAVTEPPDAPGQTRDSALADLRDVADRHLLPMAAERIPTLAAASAQGALHADTGRPAHDDVAAALTPGQRVTAVVVVLALLFALAGLRMAGWISSGGMVTAVPALALTLLPAWQWRQDRRNRAGRRAALAQLDAALARHGAAPASDAAIGPGQGAPSRVTLPDPKAALAVEELRLRANPDGADVLANVTFTLNAGDVLGIAGPGGIGKTLLLRALAGDVAPVAGRVRLDGASLDQWEAASLARHIGWFGHDPALIDGTVADNISGFADTVSASGGDANGDAGTAASVLTAAHDAASHAMLIRLPAGYATRVGRGGSALSQSQARRVALARAVHGRPFVLLLDQPLAQMDPDGQRAVAATVAAARQRGAIVVLTGHDTATIGLATHVLILNNGTMMDFGPRDAVLARQQTRQGTAQGTPAPAQTNGGGKA